MDKIHGGWNTDIPVLTPHTLSITSCAVYETFTMSLQWFIHSFIRILMCPLYDKCWIDPRDISKHTNISPAKAQESGKVLNIFTSQLGAGSPWRSGPRRRGPWCLEAGPPPKEGPYTWHNTIVTGVSFFFTRKWITWGQEYQLIYPHVPLSSISKVLQRIDKVLLNER